MDKWVKIYRCYRGMKQIVTKVENGGKFWFTCVLHPEIEPTNNSAERGLRKFVVMEKIMGCLRTEQGKKNYSNYDEFIWDLEFTGVESIPRIKGYPLELNTYQEKDNYLNM